MYISTLFILLYFTSIPYTIGGSTTSHEPSTAMEMERETVTEELSLVLMKTQLKVNQVFENDHKKRGGSGGGHGHGKIVLLGLFELTTKLGPRPEGLSELSAAQMAVQHINRKQLLPGYTLELLTNDTQVSFYCFHSTYCLF